MLLNTKKLSNGIDLSLIHSDKFKTGVLVATLTLPLTEAGAAHSLLLSSLVGRGTQKYPTMAELNRSLDELYGSYVEIRSSHVCNELSFAVSCEILDNRFVPDSTDVLGGVIDILSQLLLFPRFMEDSFDTEIFNQEKKIVLDNLKAEKNNTRAYSVKRCSELMSEGACLYPKHERLMELVEGSSLDDIRTHYKELRSASYFNIFYMGATDPCLIEDKLTSSFSSDALPCTQRTARPLVYKRSSPAFVTEKMPVSQGKLAMGFSTGVCISPDDTGYYTALMLNEIFGGSPASKLFINVRERMSLCYYCSSSFSIYNGTMTVSSGIEVARLDTVKTAILSQLEDIKNGNISEYELRAAQASVTNCYRQLYDNPFDMQAFYGGRALFGIRDSIEDCLEKLLKVTIDDISELARQVSLDAVFFVEGTLAGEPDEEVSADD